eukprot:SAG11_NODE_1879_length_4130_cov_3.133466_4_plen_159_part_00
MLVSRHLVHQLDYELGFSEPQFRAALENLNRVVSAVLTSQRGDANHSFVPLNCELYQRLLLKSVFTPLKTGGGAAERESLAGPGAGYYGDVEERGATDKLLSERYPVLGAMQVSPVSETPRNRIRPCSVSGQCSIALDRYTEESHTYHRAPTVVHHSP